MCSDVNVTLSRVTSTSEHMGACTHNNRKLQARVPFKGISMPLPVTSGRGMLMPLHSSSRHELQLVVPSKAMIARCIDSPPPSTQQLSKHVGAVQPANDNCCGVLCPPFYPLLQIHRQVYASIHSHIRTHNHTPDLRTGSQPKALECGLCTHLGCVVCPGTRAPKKGRSANTSPPLLVPQHAPSHTHTHTHELRTQKRSAAHKGIILPPFRTRRRGEQGMRNSGPVTRT